MTSMGRRDWVTAAVAVAVVGVAAWALVPVNDAYFINVINYDPQGDDQQIEWLYTDRVFTYTSGLLVGQFVALLVGVALAAGRSTLRGRLAVAVPVGLFLGIVDVAVAVPAAAARSGWRPDGAVLAQYGMTLDPVPLRDPGLLWALGTGVAAFGLFAAAGVGLGALIRRWWVMVPIGVVWWAVVLPLGLCLNMGGRLFLPLVFLPLPMLSAEATITWTASSQYVWMSSVPDWYPWAGGACLLIGAFGWAVVLNRMAGKALRRRVG